MKKYDRNGELLLSSFIGSPSLRPATFYLALIKSNYAKHLRKLKN